MININFVLQRDINFYSISLVCPDLVDFVPINRNFSNKLYRDDLVPREVSQLNGFPD